MKYTQQLIIIALSIICSTNNIHTHESTITQRAYNWISNTAEKIQEYATSQPAYEAENEWNNLYRNAGQLATDVGEISAIDSELTGNIQITVGIAGIYFVYKTYKSANTLYKRFMNNDHNEVIL